MSVKELPPCTGEDGPMSAEDCAGWLDRKYARHHELEDQASAHMIRNQRTQIDRLERERNELRAALENVLSPQPNFTKAWDALRSPGGP